MLQINLLTCIAKLDRFNFAVKNVIELQKIRNVSQIQLYIYGDALNLQSWVNFFKVHPPRFKVQLLECLNSSYPDRVRYAHQTNCEYSCKLDDDVLVAAPVWDFIINNLKVLSPQTPIISPILTNGMPSVECFIEDFLEGGDKDIAYQLLLKGRVQSNIWGLDFSKVNEKISSMTKWDGREYWNFVETVDTKWDKLPVPWYYFMVRGVHPARFSYDYNMFIADRVLKNKGKFFAPHAYRFETYDAPYFTNNVFVCRTEYWRNSYTLFADGWDEGQLTLQNKLNRSQILYVRNGFGIHMAYGMTERQAEIENYYTSNI